MLFDGEREILERTVIRNWMSQWLRWVSWFHTVGFSVDSLSIEDLLRSALSALAHGSALSLTLKVQIRPDMAIV